MLANKILKKDFLLLPILSVVYFLTIKSDIPSIVYLLIALLTSIYFFPIKLFLGYNSTKFTDKKRIVVLLSYFISSNVIVLSALVSFQADLEVIRIAILIYSILNIALLIYFHFTESGSYNFILTCCAVFLNSAVAGIS